jgi:hypothetical protein
MDELAAVTRQVGAKMMAASLTSLLAHCVVGAVVHRFDAGDGHPAGLVLQVHFWGKQKTLGRNIQRPCVMGCVHGML